jgi:hypothetical protein
MDTHFEVGDTVKVTSSFVFDNRKFLAGDIGEVLVVERTILIRWERVDKEWSSERWWVPTKFVTKVEQGERHPNYKVINKIKRMQSKRKEQGYAF